MLYVRANLNISQPELCYTLCENIKKNAKIHHNSEAILDI